MHVAVSALARQLKVRSGVAADLVFEPMGLLQRRLDAGESADVLILGAPAIDALARSGALIFDSRVDVARAPIGIAIREGTPAPDVSTPVTFRAALIAAHTIALSDPAVGGSAGIYLRDLFARMGLAELIAAKTVAQRSGVAAADAVGRGDAELAITFVPELLQGRGTRVVGSLPSPYDHATTYAAGVSAHTELLDAARMFIAALTAPDARHVWVAVGFEVDL